MGKTKIIILIVGGIVIVALALTLGLVFGLKKDKSIYRRKKKVNIVNSYDNTDELIIKFPVENPTTVKEGIEKKIQNRLLTGFENWNRGFDAWKAWGNILYTEDSIYNVHGARLTLAQYQASMDITLKQTTIYMGAFHNMLICGDFTAIYYDIITVVSGNNISGTVMEFVKFKDYGEELGTRVVEGWGGTKDRSYESMINFQGDEEKAVQEEQNNYMINYEIPSETDLKIKYIILNPTEFIDSNAETILNIILNGFEDWNNGLTDYINWIDTYFDPNARSTGLQRKDRTITEYKEEITTLFGKEEIKKLYFDNVLIRDNWAGIHYRFRSKDTTTNVITVGDRMEFLKFEQQGADLKIVGYWIK